MRAPISQLILLTSIVFCCSCSAGEDQGTPVTAETYVHSEKATDSSSPVGYWTTEVSYPVFSGKNEAQEVADQLNHKLESFMARHQCSDGGDESFEAEVHTLEENLVSIRYVAMWSCAAMPSPASKEGAITVALPSLEDIDLERQISDSARYETFLKKVEALYVSEMTKKGRVEACPFSGWEYYTVQPDTISLHIEQSSHYPSDCAATIQFPRKDLKNLVSPDSPLIN